MNIIYVAITLLITIFTFSVFISSHSYKFKKEPNKFTPAKYGYDFNEIRIPTKNNKNLYGWWVPTENPKEEKLPTIVLVHGWSRNVDRTMSYIKQLRPAGYNLLAFDSRSHGKSDDDNPSTMIKFMEDIRSAIDYTEKQPKVDTERIGLLGLSIGGSASIYAASLDDRVKSVVTIGAFSHPRKVMTTEFKRHRIPNFPFIWIIFKYMEFRIGVKLDDVAPVNNIAKSNAQFYLIHGVNDATVPIEQGVELLNAGKSEKVKLWKVEGKEHSDCNHHPEFWGNVISFLKLNL